MGPVISQRAQTQRDPVEKGENGAFPRRMMKEKEILTKNFPAIVKKDNKNSIKPRKRQKQLQFGLKTTVTIQQQ
jgi:hypothetical protein